MTYRYLRYAYEAPETRNWLPDFWPSLWLRPRVTALPKLGHAADHGPCRGRTAWMYRRLGTTARVSETYRQESSDPANLGLDSAFRRAEGRAEPEPGGPRGAGGREGRAGS